MDWGDADGGFINDGTFEEPQQVVGSVSVGGEEKNKAIAAVSVSQIVKLTRPSEGLVIHKKKIYYVNLVAMVHEVIDINPQKVHILVDDFTSGGPLEVTHIIGDSGEPDKNPIAMEIKVGDYVRCIGVVKSTQEKSNLVAYNLRFIDDPNFIAMHILEVIRDSLMFAELQTNGSRIPEEIKPAPMNQARQANDGFGKLSTREKHVLKYLQEKATSDEGLHINEIVKNLGAFSKNEIEQSLTTLSSEGFCWQGDTEELWCVNRTDI